MKHYSELTTVNRTVPCIEYPGQWLVFYNDAEDTVATLDSFDEAMKTAKYAASLEECSPSICWEASNDDPRIGEVWFTGFYQHGKFDQFGQYRS